MEEPKAGHHGELPHYFWDERCTCEVMKFTVYYQNGCCVCVYSDMSLQMAQLLTASQAVRKQYVSERIFARGPEHAAANEGARQEPLDTVTTCCSALHERHRHKA